MTQVMAVQIFPAYDATMRRYEKQYDELKTEPANARVHRPGSRTGSKGRVARRLDGGEHTRTLLV